MKKTNVLDIAVLCFLVLTLVICFFVGYGNKDKPASTLPFESETEKATSSPDITAETKTSDVTSDTTIADITTETKTPVVPIITGVKKEMTVYSDETFESVKDMLLDGVHTAEGESCLVKVKILNEDGEEVEKLSEGKYSVVYFCDRKDVKEVRNTLTVKYKDTVPPVIEGAADKTVYVGNTLSYRAGVTVSDNYDENVSLIVDASRVDLTSVGTYPLTYSAADKSGNSTSVTVNVTVMQAPQEQPIVPAPICTKEELDDLCRNILGQIINDGMSDYEKANAIYNRVRQIRYVGSSDKDNWVFGAYLGLTTGRGDCFNYYAASKALLTLAGIPNYDLQRKGGDQPHYWQLVCVDGKWYHFDACPTLDVYPIRCFLYTEEEVAAYTEAIAWACPDYYVYDYESCPYEVVRSRNS